MSTDNIVLGHYRDPHKAEKAIRALRAAGHEVNYYSPFPEPHLEEAAFEGKPRSNVRMFTLAGGLTGCLGAFLFTTWMSIDYPLRVSAKPLVSIPSFIVIAFECTILLGAIFTLVGMCILSRIPNLSHFPDYRPEFSEGTFGVAVRVPEERAEELRQAIAELEAEKVEVQYVR